MCRAPAHVDALTPVDGTDSIPNMRRALQVGHNALGAGQIIDQGARLVDNAISSGSMWTHEDGWMYIKPVHSDQWLVVLLRSCHTRGCLDAAGEVEMGRFVGLPTLNNA